LTQGIGKPSAPGTTYLTILEDYEQASGAVRASAIILFTPNEIAGVIALVETGFLT